MFLAHLHTSAQNESFEEGKWIWTGTTNDNELDVFVLSKPLKDDTRDPNDWYSKYYTTSNNITIKMWVLYRYKNKSKKIKNTYIYEHKNLIEINLIMTTSRDIEDIYYDKNGNVLYNSNDTYYYNDEWTNIIPNSIGQSIFDQTIAIIEEIQQLDFYKNHLNNANENEKAGNLENALYYLKKANKIYSDSLVLLKITELETKVSEDKREVYLRNGLNAYNNNNYGDCLNNYKKAYEIRASKELASLIEKVEKESFEVKREELILNASNNYELGLLSHSLDALENAQKIRESSDIQEKISQLKIEISTAKEKRNQIASLILELIPKETDITTICLSLEKIKTGYGEKFRACINMYESKRNESWEIIEEHYSIYKNINRDNWTKDEERLLTELLELKNLNSTIELFKSNIEQAISEKDKKFLKVFKDDDLAKIIETVIRNN